MKRSEIDSIIARSIATAAKLGVALPTWAGWSPCQFGASAEGVRRQGLGWKVVDFGLGDFAHCGLVVLVVCNSLLDESGEPLAGSRNFGERQYPATGFSRKFLFVQAGQTEPHHFHRQKTRKEVTVLAGGPVRFELAWAKDDNTLSSLPVDVQVDGIWHQLPMAGSACRLVKRSRSPLISPTSFRSFPTVRMRYFWRRRQRTTIIKIISFRLSPPRRLRSRQMSARATSFWTSTQPWSSSTCPHYIWCNAPGRGANKVFIVARR